jgi:hypothetical protein
MGLLHLLWRQQQLRLLRRRLRWATRATMVDRLALAALIALGWIILLFR